MKLFLYIFLATCLITSCLGYGIPKLKFNDIQFSNVESPIQIIQNYHSRYTIDSISFTNNQYNFCANENPYIPIGRKGELISSETKQLDGISCSSYQYGSLESESPMLFIEQVVCDKNTVTERDEPIPAQGVYIKSRIELLPEIPAEATHMCLRSLIETDLDYSRNTKYEVEGIGGVYNPTETKYQNFSKFAWRTGNIYLGFFHRDYAIINQDKTPYNVNLTLEYCIANTTHSEAKTVNSSLYMVSCLEIDHLQEGELASIELIIGPHVLYEFNVDYESDCMISTYSHNEGHLISGMFVGIALGIAIALLVISIISVACVKKYCVLKSKVTARGFEHVSE